MISLDDLLNHLPVRDLRADAGTKSSRKGGATVLLDLEPAEKFEAVDAISEKIRSHKDAVALPELVPMCFTSIVAGVQIEFEERFGVEKPPIRVVVREVLPHMVESNVMNNRAVGKRAIRLAFVQVIAAVSKFAVGDRCLIPAYSVGWYPRESAPPGVTKAAFSDLHHERYDLVGKTEHFEFPPEEEADFECGVPVTIMEIDGHSAVVETFHHRDAQTGEPLRIDCHLGRLLPYPLELDAFRWQ